MKRAGIRRFAAPIGAVLVVAMMMGALPASAAGPPSGKASPSKNLTNGKSIKISGKGWPAGDSLVIVECNSSAVGLTDLNACDTDVIGDATASSKGKVPKTAFTFITGTIGDGTCNPGETCYMVLTEPSSGGLHVLIPVTVKKAKK